MRTNTRICKQCGRVMSSAAREAGRRYCSRTCRDAVEQVAVLTPLN